MTTPAVCMIPPTTKIQQAVRIAPRRPRGSEKEARKAPQKHPAVNRATTVPERESPLVCRKRCDIYRQQSCSKSAILDLESFKISRGIHAIDSESFYLAAAVPSRYGVDIRQLGRHIRKIVGQCRVLVDTDLATRDRSVHFEPLVMSKPAVGWLVTAQDQCADAILLVAVLVLSRSMKMSTIKFKIE
ncbi:hypothetical protein KC333_g26 [Hortaea werneckii]|nr:hypothetical protein KC333_g26 [Hortaea werneckii]